MMLGSEIFTTLSDISSHLLRFHLGNFVVKFYFCGVYFRQSSLLLYRLLVGSHHGICTQAGKERPTYRPPHSKGTEAGSCDEASDKSAWMPQFDATLTRRNKDVLLLGCAKQHQVLSFVYCS